MTEVPSYILGEEVYEGEGFSKAIFEYGDNNPYQSYWVRKLFKEDSISLEVSQLSSKEKVRDLCRKIRKNHKKIKNKSVKEISEIIKKVGEEMKEDKEFQETKKLLSVLYGRSPEVVEIEIEMLTNGMINNREVIETQAGGIEKLEERKPVGLVYNILAGNTAIIPIQICYSKLCRNVDFIKTASGDPAMAIELGKRLGKEDKTIEESLIITYFPGERKDFHELLVSEADKVVVYGGMETIENVRALSKKYGKSFVDHGPRRAFWYIGKTSEKIGDKILQDVIPFEQTACVSPYIGFVNEKNDIESIAKQILNASIDYSEKFPPTPNWEEVRRKESFWEEKGAKVYTPMQVLREQRKSPRKRMDNYTRVVILPEDLDIKENEDELLDDSVYRFIFLKPVKNEKEVINYLEETGLRNYISRVGIENGEALKEYVQRNMPKAEICEIGRICFISPYEKHDGYYDLLEISKERSENFFITLIKKLANYFGV